LISYLIILLNHPLTMPKPKGNTIHELNLGKLIRSRQQQQRITHAVLARRLKRDQSAIKRMLNNTSIQTYLVWELSVALGHNFFTDLAQQLDAATEGRLEKQTTELDELKLEYARLKEERDYLRKAVDLLGK
jgi:plasmid maintenance system antidote protein VapI